LAETAGAGSPPRAALRPVFPEKPFLVNLPDRPRLFPGVELPLNLELPPLLKLTVFPPPALPGEPPGEPASAGAAVSGETLFTFTPFPLNETWYGDTTMKGVLCLSLSVSAGEGADPEGALVRCGALIQNRTKAILELSQFPLYAGELSIYQKEGALVTDTPVLDASENGNFRVSLRSPGGVLVAEGNKNGVGDLLIQRGSRIIKNITGL
jgi:hypothetical protein